MAMRIPVRQMSGKVAVLEVVPEMTVQEFKQQLRGLGDWELQQADISLSLSRGPKHLFFNFLSISRKHCEGFFRKTP